VQLFGEVMPMHTLFFPSVSGLLAAIFGDSSGTNNSILSMIVAAAGASATLASNWNSLTESRTLRAQIKSKTERVEELVDLLNKLPEKPQFVLSREKVAREIDCTLSELNLLTEKDLRKQETAKGELTFSQRTFILFPPAGSSAWIIHFFAYLFMFGGPTAILLAALFGGKDRSSIVSDLVILVVFGALAFRGWALASRRWNVSGPAGADSPAEETLACKLFVMRRPRHARMLVAQIFLWISVFCVLESLEDLILEGMEGKGWTHGATAALCLFVTAGVVTVLCQAWANSEWCHASRPEECPRVLAPFGDFLLTHKVASLFSFFMPVSLVLWKWDRRAEIWANVSVFWGDVFDRSEAGFLLLAFMIAVFHLLVFHFCWRVSDPGLSGENLNSFAD